MQNAPERVPQLVDMLSPPEVIGTAALTTAAMNGTALDALLTVIDETDPDPVAQLFDMSVVCMLASPDPAGSASGAAD